MNERDRTNEVVRTLVYAGVAFVLAVIGMATYPRPPRPKPIEAVNKPLFAEFDDVEKAVTLEIAHVDEELGDFHEFKVERKKSGWVIPSHSNYPADAEDQMRDAAVLLKGLIVSDVVPNAGDLHEDFGVIEPNKERTSIGQKGVGLFVRIGDKKDTELASLIIGKKVKGDEEKRFVRKPRQDPVYIAEIDVEKLSTKFEDWIEKDLLKLTALDLESVTLKDYSVDLRPTQIPGSFVPDYVPKLEVTLKTDTTEGWVLKEMLTFDQNRQPARTDLSDQEELNEDALDDLKSALDDLEIVNVRRKPEGVAANLKGDKSLIENAEIRTSLINVGVFPVPVGEGRYDVKASNGEVIATMEDGVEYVLRFGDVAGTQEGTEKLNRYLFVMARVNENKFPAPELETPPEIPTAEEDQAREPSDNDAADNDEKEDAAGSDSTEKQEADEADENNLEDGDESKTVEELKEQREQILKENKRKLEEREEKLQEAQDEVRDLNDRFADWYYVVSEDMYKKMRLRRADLIKEKETAEDEGFGIDAFRKLEDEGLQKEDDSDDDPA